MKQESYFPTLEKVLQDLVNPALSMVEYAALIEAAAPNDAAFRASRYDDLIGPLTGISEGKDTILLATRKDKQGAIVVTSEDIDQTTYNETIVFDRNNADVKELVKELRYYRNKANKAARAVESYEQAQKLHNGGQTIEQALALLDSLPGMDGAKARKDAIKAFLDKGAPSMIRKELVKLLNNVNPTNIQRAINILELL